jgi:hypothetical protein
LRAIKEVLGTFISLDDCYKIGGVHSVAQILVALDLRKGIFESIDLVVGDHSYTHALDYMDIPFRCSCCHKVGHLLKD